MNNIDAHVQDYVISNNNRWRDVPNDWTALIDGAFQPSGFVCEKGPLRSASRYDSVIAKFHYMDPTGPARTLSETHTDPTEFLGETRAAKKSVRVRSGPVGPVWWNLAIIVPPNLQQAALSNVAICLRLSVCVSLFVPRL